MLPPKRALLSIPRFDNLKSVNLLGCKLCTNGSKISFTPKGGRFCEDNFLRYLGLCYVNPTHHKLKTSPLL